MFGFGPTSKNSSKKENAWNLLNAELARNRIRYTVGALIHQGSLKSSITDRYHQLKEFGIGGQTLYKYLDLWHPDHINKASSTNKLLQTKVSLVKLLDRDVKNSKGSNDLSALEKTRIARDMRLGRSLGHKKATDRLPEWEFDQVDRGSQKGRSRSV